MYVAEQRGDIREAARNLPTAEAWTHGKNLFIAKGLVSTAAANGFRPLVMPRRVVFVS